METKRCARCHLDLPVTEFSKHHRQDLQYSCRPCNRAYQRAHYLANKADYIAKAAKWMAVRKDQNLAKILAYFDAHPCADCGETDPVVLQFDHVRGEKVHEVTEMLGNGTCWEKIATEIAKCDVRCANCHWRRHAKERGWRKLALAASWSDQKSLVAPAGIEPASAA